MNQQNGLRVAFAVDAGVILAAATAAFVLWGQVSVLANDMKKLNDEEIPKKLTRLETHQERIKHDVEEIKESQAQAERILREIREQQIRNGNE